MARAAAGNVLRGGPFLHPGPLLLTPPPNPPGAAKHQKKNFRPRGQRIPGRRVSCSDPSAKGSLSLTTEDELIRRAQAGDLDAFCRLARGYERRVYSLALHFCRDPHDAEDLSQEVWLKAFKSLGSFRHQSGFYTWLRRITINSFLNHRRALTMTHENEKTALRFDSLEELAGGAGPSDGTAENGFHRRLLVERVMAALGELTPQQRLMFLLKHREGMTYKEIADSFGCSTGAVKKSLFRTLLKLRAALGVGAEAGCVSLPAGD
jgi:RNA polymerase sigma-70 factor (ECF subfamily)